MFGEPANRDHLDFLQGLMKRGFVNIPRLLFDYVGDLKMDYDTIGKLFAVMACVGGPGESAFDTYRLDRNARDYEQIRTLIHELEDEDLVKSEVVPDENGGEQLEFSFGPLYYRMQVIWKEHREKHDQDSVRKVHPAVQAAEAVLAKTFSKNEVEDILDWVTNYGFTTELVSLVCLEAKRKNIVRQSYLNEIARSWYDAGVRTPEQVEDHLQKLQRATGKNKTIIRELNLGRNLTGPELAMLEKWSSDWGFSNEVIIRAAEVAAGTKAPLQYMNAVLEGWKEHGVRTVADAEVALTEYKRRPTSDAATSARARRGTPPSNVIRQSEHKDESHYGYNHRKSGK